MHTSKRLLSALTVGLAGASQAHCVHYESAQDSTAQARRTLGLMSPLARPSLPSEVHAPKPPSGYGTYGLEVAGLRTLVPMLEPGPLRFSPSVLKPLPLTMRLLRASRLGRGKHSGLKLFVSYGRGAKVGQPPSCSPCTRIPSRLIALRLPSASLRRRGLRLLTRAARVRGAAFSSPTCMLAGDVLPASDPSSGTRRAGLMALLGWSLRSSAGDGQMPFCF